MNFSIFMGSATRTREPRANRFRVGDTWRGPEGRTYIVKEEHDDGRVLLHSIGWNTPLRIRDTAVEGFSRTHWGGLD
jgi:ribosomal protein L32E